MNLNIFELNNLNYKQALLLDKRTYIQFYLDQIKSKHLLVFSFLPMRDYNSRIIKIDLFFFIFSINLIINALFFNEDTMHQIYQDEGEFNFIYQIPQILYSSVLSAVLNIVLKSLALSEQNVLSIKHCKFIDKIKKKAKAAKRCLKLKFSIYFVISTGLLGFFWYYMSCFCAVFVNTQVHVIKDTLISFGLSFLYPFGIYLLPGIFRIPALKADNKCNERLFQISQILQMV